MKLKRTIILFLVFIACVSTSALGSLSHASDGTAIIPATSSNLAISPTTEPTRLAFYHVPPSIHNVVATPTVIAGGTVTVTVNLREPSTRDGRVLLSRRIGTSATLWKEKNFRKGHSRIIFRSLPVGCGSPGSNLWMSKASQYKFRILARLKYWEGNGSTVTTVVKYGNPVNVLKYVPWVRFVSQIYPAGRRNYFRPGENARHEVNLKQKSCDHSQLQLEYQIRKWDSQSSAYLNYYPGTGNLTLAQNPVTVKHGTTRAVFTVRLPANEQSYQYRIRARTHGTNQRWVYGAWVSVHP